jgi:iron complex transport system ATP-binding protein
METFRSLTKFEEERVCYFFDQLKVESSWDFPLGHLSGGRRQLVRLSCALARPCPIVFLDEPLNSLDPLAQDDAMKVIQEVARENSVLAITHSINHSLQSNGNFLGLRNGGLAFKGSRQELETTKGLDLLFSRSFTWGEIDGVRVVR